MDWTTLTRRDFLGVSGGALLSGAMGQISIASSSTGKNKPNMLVILVDDLGYADLHCYGSNDLRTPHTDQLVKEGIRFDNFYANCPVCSPTRAALLSGRYQEMVGVPGVIRTHDNNSWGYLKPDSKLMPELLKPAGYSTALIGKWHLGLEPPNIPNERGFDFFHGFLGDMMDDYYTHRRHNINYMRLNKEEIDPEGHATDLFSQWACEYLEDQKGNENPFFLYLAYNAPHTPIQPPQDWVEKIKKREPGIDEDRAKLCALIEHMDHGIGQVLNTLHETGLDENTIVVFSSDNGGLLRVGANNGPLRAGKGTLYEGGIRVPTAVRWPGKIKPGTRTERIALTMDIMPTLFEAAGLKIEHEIDGRSILPTLLGKDQPEFKRDLFWGRKEGGAFKGKHIEAIRRGDWKLLEPMPDEPYELYNLKTDPYEKNNLAEKRPKKYEELKAALQAQLEKYYEVPWQPPK